MWDLLTRLGTGCWGHHDWISKANARGLWLECRRCGRESAGLELPSPSFRRTQDADEAAHRLARPAPVAPAEPRRVGARVASRRTSVSAQWLVTAGSSSAVTEGERRWLQAWRAMSPEEQTVAERMVAGLTEARVARVANRPGTADNRPTLAGRTRVRAFGETSPTHEPPMAAAR